MTIRPNVVIFMTDQQSGATIDPRHQLKAVTPHLDAFREDAAFFRSAFAPSPHCCPSRASFFSSTYPSEHGVWNNVNVPNALSRGPRPGVRMWSEDFAGAGYRLGFTGKWHVSNSGGPSRYGWDELYPEGLDRGPELDLAAQRRRAIDQQLEILEVADAGPADRPRGGILRPGWPSFTLYGAQEDPFDDSEVVREAVEFIASGRGQDPWMLFVGTLGPHDPYSPPQRFLDLYDRDSLALPATFWDDLADKPALYRRTRDLFDQLGEDEQLDALHHYLAFCSYEDELFGRVVGALRGTGQYDSTVVAYVSDHGDYAGDHGLWTKGLPAFRSAYHVPLVIKPAAGSPAPREVETPVTLLDIGPTLLELCGVPSDRPSSGRSLVPALDAADALERIDIHFQTNGNEVYGIQRTVVTERWKLVVNLFDDDELYDLEADPGELSNLLFRGDRTRRLGADPFDAIPARIRDVARDLYSRMWDFALEHDDEIVCPYIFTALARFGPLDALERRRAPHRKV